MAAITSSNVANAIVKLVAVDALPVLIGNLVMGNLVNRDYEPVLAQAGDTVNIPIPPTMVANNIAEGGTVQTQNPSLGNAQIVLNTHAEATFQIPDVTKVLAVPDLLRIFLFLHTVRSLKIRQLTGIPTVWSRHIASETTITNRPDHAHLALLGISLRVLPANVHYSFV